MAKEVKNAYTIEAESKLGHVQIADDVVAAIAGIATMEVEGVAAMAGTTNDVTKELIAKLGKKNLSKGVKVDILEGIATIDIVLVLKYGKNIKATTEKVQERVKASVENMTGLTVADVNIRVAAVEMPEEE